jgi:hypothetical protein
MKSLYFGELLNDRIQYKQPETCTRVPLDKSLEPPHGRIHGVCLPAGNRAKNPPTKGRKDRADRDLSARVKNWNLADRHTPKRNVLLCCLTYGFSSIKTFCSTPTPHSNTDAFFKHERYISVQYRWSLCPSKERGIIYSPALVQTSLCYLKQNVLA